MRQLWEIALENRRREAAYAPRTTPRRNEADAPRPVPRKPRALSLTEKALRQPPFFRFEFAAPEPGRAEYASRRFRT